MLAGVGAAAGVLLATGGVQLLLAFFVDPDSPSLLVATPNLRVLGFTALVAGAAGLLFGLAPALQSTRPALAPTLKDQAGTVAGGAGVRIRKALVVSQVALSLLLLVGAGLFIRSFQRMMAADLGFRTEQIVTFGANPTQIGYRGHRVKQYAMDLLARVRATPGVVSAAVARVPLLGGGAWGEALSIEGRAKPRRRRSRIARQRRHARLLRDAAASRSGWAATSATPTTASRCRARRSTSPTRAIASPSSASRSPSGSSAASRSDGTSASAPIRGRPPASKSSASSAIPPTPA